MHAYLVIRFKQNRLIQGMYLIHADLSLLYIWLSDLSINAIVVFLHMICNVMISFVDFNSLCLIVTHVLVKTVLFVTFLINIKIAHTFFLFEGFK